MKDRGADALARADCKGIAEYIRWMSNEPDYHFLMGLARLLDPACKSEEFQLIAQRRLVGTPSKELGDAWIVARINEKLAELGGKSHGRKKAIYHDVGVEAGGLSGSRVAEIYRQSKSTNK
jgi:hypothetical protein